MAGTHLDFYFDFSSPYGYLAAVQIEELAARHGRRVAWKPFLLGAVYKKIGGQPLVGQPLKGDYSLRDMQRTARDRTTLFFMIVLPIVIMVVIGSTFGGMQGITIGVVDDDGTAASADLIATVDGEDIDIERYESAATLRRDIRAGSLAAGLVVPEGYGATLDAGDDVTVDMVSDASSASAAVSSALATGASTASADSPAGTLPEPQAASAAANARQATAAAACGVDRIISVPS